MATSLAALRPRNTAGAAPSNARPSTQTMSSLGSSGSRGGGFLPSAAPTSSSPKPVPLSKPLRPRSRAESRTTCAAWSGERSGRAARIQATAAETIGAEKLVPSRRM